MADLRNVSVSFDDVQIKPRYVRREVSRSDASLHTKLGSVDLKYPILSANMETVTGVEMAVALAKLGAMPVLHRFWNREDSENCTQRNAQALGEVLSRLEVADRSRVAVSIGVGEKGRARAQALREVGAVTFVIDVAHGAQLKVAQMVSWLRDVYGSEINVVAGNFATKESLEEFLHDIPTGSLDAVKVGIGGGSCCETRSVTGVGYPQLAAVMECSDLGVPVISDGGCKTTGDVAKALAGGADMVMSGLFFAGCDEAPGHRSAGKKSYAGSAYLPEPVGHKASEGISTEVTCVGSVEKVLLKIENGLRSSFGYQGARTIGEFQALAEFVRVSTLSRRETLTLKDY